MKRNEHYSQILNLGNHNTATVEDIRADLLKKKLSTSMKCKIIYDTRQPKPLHCGKYWFKNKQVPTYPVLVNFAFVIKTSPFFQCNFRDPRKVCHSNKVNQILRAFRPQR